MPMSYIIKLISLVTHILFINEGDVILLEKALSQPFYVILSKVIFWVIAIVI